MLPLPPPRKIPEVVLFLKASLTTYGVNIIISTQLLARVHNIRGIGEYPTLLVWPNTLCKVMM